MGSSHGSPVLALHSLGLGFVVARMKLNFLLKSIILSG
jgi:hypothetical protein